MALFQRKTSGSTLCRSCGKLVGVNDERCFHCGQAQPGLFGFGEVLRNLGNDLAFGKVVVTACVIFYAIALLMDPSQLMRGGILGLLSPASASLEALGMSGARPIFVEGRWWTVLTAGWLHGSLLHIGFNMYWTAMLAPIVAQYFGPGRTAILFTGSSVAGFAITSGMLRLAVELPGPLFGLLKFLNLQGAGNTVGASAAIFGWIGALIYAGRRRGSGLMQQQLMGFILPMLILGMLIPMIDNWAHIGGLGSGYLLARWLDPTKKEHINHVLIGFGLVLVSWLAIIYSWWSAQPLLRG